MSPHLPSQGLSLFRRGLGALCLFDALMRLGSASFLLSDLGAMPRAVYYTLFDTNWNWSVYLVSGRTEFALVLLLLTALLGVLNLAGKSTRWSRAALWVLVASVQVRNPGLLDSADDLLRLLLFWDIFLPCESSEPVQISSPATLGLQAQLTLTLLFTAFFMTGERFALAAQWGLATQASSFPWFFTLERVVLVLLALALWWPGTRKPLLVLGVLALAGQALLLGFAFPLTLAVGLLSLLSFKEHAVREESYSKVQYVAVLTLTAVCLATNLSKAETVERWSEALAVEQDWSQLYPRASRSLYEVVVKSPQGTVWFITRDSGRRLRNYAQQIGENYLWAHNLPRAIAQEQGLETSLTVLVSETEVKPDFSFGEFKVVKL